MSNQFNFKKCHICESRKCRKSSLPEIVNAVEIDCSENHRFCLTCINLYSRIDQKCPLCASNYNNLSRLDDGYIVEKHSIEHRKHEIQLSDEETKLYIDYLDTISDLSSDEELEVGSMGKGEMAECRIRNRIKQIKRLLHCDGVKCNSKECFSAEHNDDCSEAIEEFHVGDYEWREAEDRSAFCADKVLKREKTFEELLQECEQFVESAIKDEEQ